MFTIKPKATEVITSANVTQPMFNHESAAFQTITATVTPSILSEEYELNKMT